jgi:CheY-like chemotaxis protein
VFHLQEKVAMADKKTVLIIDDEPDTLVYFSNVLQDHGYATVTAADAAHAIEHVKASPPDLVTLDITMPDTSGIRCYRTLREHPAWRAIPVVIITGVSEDFRRYISTRSSVPPPDGYLSKPVDEADLLQTVSRLVGTGAPVEQGS